MLAFLKRAVPLRRTRRSGFPRRPRRRHQAGLARGQRAARPRRHRLRDRPEAQERHARAQGQHHEVHRGRVPQLGLRARRARVRRPGLHVGAVGADQGRRRASRPRTPSSRRRSPPARVLVKDAIADITLQQVLTRPDEFDVIATLNLNGDYLSDALAAQVGGIGIAPGGNINYETGHAMFEATHGTAPKYAEPRQGEPGLADALGRDDAALPGLERGRGPVILKGMDGAIGEQARDLRLRAADGGRDRDQVQRVRRQHHRPHVAGKGAGGMA